MTKGDKLIRLIEVLKEAETLAKEMGVLSVYCDLCSHMKVHFPEEKFPLANTLVENKAHTEELDRHSAMLAGVELFYLTDREEEEIAVI